MSNTTDNQWPSPHFQFQIEWNNEVCSFQEVGGLNIESQPIEYRSGNSSVFSPIKMPGLQKYGNVTLKKGMTPLNLSQFTAWVNEIKIKRTPLIIKLLDETGQTTMTWTLQNAVLTKINHSANNENDESVAIDTAEVTCEGITIS